MASRWSRWAGCGGLLTAVGLAAAEPAWEPMPPMPEPNGGFACAVLPDAIIVAGGTNWVDGKKIWIRDVRRFDLRTQTWATLEPLPEPLAYAFAGVLDREVVLVGGTAGSGAFHGAYRLSDGRKPVVVAEGFATAAVLGAGGQSSGEILCVGGTDDLTNPAGYGRNAFAWNLRSGVRRSLPDYPGPPVGLAASVVVGDEWFVFGGATWDADTKSARNLDTAYAYSLAKQQWRRLPPFPFAVRGLTAVALDARHLLLAGGYKNPAEEFTAEAYVYDLVENRYLPAPPLPYRAMVALVRAGDHVYCLGGEDRQRHRSAAVFRIKVSDLLPR